MFDRQGIEDLRRLRREGVQLRVEGGALLSEESVKDWRLKQLQWEAAVMEILTDFPIRDRAEFEVLDQWHSSLQFPGAFNDEHRKYLQVLAEKTRRLQEIINRNSPGRQGIKDG
jgi:hypothetical protein